jgi:hypothetical protein
MNKFVELLEPSQLLPAGTPYDNKWYVTTVECFDEQGNLEPQSNTKSWFLYPNGEVLFMAAQYDDNNRIVDNCFFDDVYEATRAVADYYKKHNQIYVVNQRTKSQDLFDEE